MSQLSVKLNSEFTGEAAITRNKGYELDQRRFDDIAPKQLVSIGGFYKRAQLHSVYRYDQQAALAVAEHLLGDRVRELIRADQKAERAETGAVLHLGMEEDELILADTLRLPVLAFDQNEITPALPEQFSALVAKNDVDLFCFCNRIPLEFDEAVDASYERGEQLFESSASLLRVF